MDAEGVQPLNRPIGYKKIERRKEKKLKKRAWGTRGGHVAPIIVPATPGGVLAKRLRKICEAEAVPGIKFRIAERGGITIERQLQKSNPTMSDQCGRADCGPCLQPGGAGGKKRCHVNSVVYEYVCQYEGCDAKYTGETSKNLYTRNSEHSYNYSGGARNSLDIKKKSFMHNHQISKHNGEPANFKSKVLRSYSDSLSRQAAEATVIRNMNCEILNSKSEFHQPSIVEVRREISRGL